ncbi:alpha/beta fold hydrolase [Actinocatenispora rupis]|uniref:Alpha/beta hydrolase n=1 Tax=Actinocatenispora rupis TaxID=519421 RepID=A0A8J3JF05_9ACTN|nr:alpha/beta hydrolase [Actinocatenispora rupis]GID14728.1 alpha/beta hydrolase [Actinocatenispora rupis]
MTGPATTTTVPAADGTPLAVRTVGPTDADRTLVLAHGWALTSAYWNPVVRRVARAVPGLRVVAYDQRHHGGSGRGRSALSVDLLGTDLARVLAETAPRGRILLGGHSMGGMTLLAFAAAYPEVVESRVDGVALVSTSAGDLARDTPGLLRALRGRLGRTILRCPSLVDGARRLLPPSVPAHRDRMARLLFGHTTAPEVVRAGAAAIHHCPIRTIVEFVPALDAHDKRTALAPLAGVPVRVLVGTEDRLTPPRHARFLAEHIPGADLTVLPGRGHMLALEDPETVASTLIALAAREGGKDASLPA